MNTFSVNVSHSLRGIMQMGIVMSHLHYALAGSIMLFFLANKVGTSIIALYFFISGYGLMYGYRRAIAAGVASFDGFIKKRLWGITRPFLLVLGLYLLGLYWDQGSIPQDMLYNLVMHGTTPLPNSWFIFVLLGLYTSFYIVFGLIKPSNGAGLLLLFIAGLLLIAIPIALDYERAWWATTLAFATGALYADRERELFALSGRWWMIALLFGLIIAILLLPWEVLLPLAFIPIPILIIQLLNRCGYCKWIDELYTQGHRNALPLERERERERDA